MPTDGAESEATLAKFAAAGVDTAEVAATLQSNGAKSFDDAWRDLLAHIDTQSASLRG